MGSEMCIRDSLIMTRNLSQSAGFYSNILGFKITSQSTEQVMMSSQGNLEIILKLTSNEAFNCKGYTPMLLLNSSAFDFIHSKLGVYQICLDDSIQKDEFGLRVGVLFANPSI